MADENSLTAALKPFGWTCTEDFWRRYYGDPWVFNLANAVERLTAEVERLRRNLDGIAKADLHGVGVHSLREWAREALNPEEA